jgi:hypothetical protein
MGGGKMARQFVMSMYANKEDLYKAKAEYWETMAHEALIAAFTSVNGIFQVILKLINS